LLSNIKVVSYRPDIDGLRAISVLAVIGYHFFPDLFQAGFIGVDIFFVISGFLISKIIIEKLDSDSFSFIEFYSRRIRRIFPALILVLFVSYIFSYFVLFENEFKLIGLDIFNSASFIYNFSLINSSGYFDTLSITKPLLHLWSLSIEEQFYVFWPLILWSTFRIGLSKKFLFLILFLFSFVVNIYYINTDTVLSFYSPISRFWELLAGAFLANIRISEKSELQRDIYSLVGFSFLILGMVLISESSKFPGWWALFPVFGTMLLIIAGPNGVVNKSLLSRNFLVYIGLISFPLYLWHWPIFSFANILNISALSLLMKLIMICISILLAWGTYKFIERPIRTYKASKLQSILLITFMVIVGLLGYHAYKNNGLGSARYTVHYNDFAQRAWGFDAKNHITCTSIMQKVDSAFCHKTDTNPKVAIIGDSHAGHLFYGFANSNNENYNKVIILGAGGCMPTLGVVARPGCDQQLDIAIDFIKKTDSIELVILSGFYGDLGLKEENVLSNKHIDGYKKTVEKLQSFDKKIIFVIDTPSFKNSKIAQLCAPKPLPIRAYFHNYPDFCYGLEGADLHPQNLYEKFIEELRHQVKNVLFYNPNLNLCPEGKCNLFHERKLLYTDSNHLSIYGSQFFFKDFEKKFPYFSLSFNLKDYKK
jgi:peptidoglycan/LPS O-acetylase OafA/YrhL